MNKDTQEQVEKMIKHIISLIPKMEVVVNVGGDTDIVDLKEILPYELEKAFTQIIKDTEEKSDKRFLEIKDRLTYFYAKTDGTLEFPNNAEGDLLKLVYEALTPPTY